MIVWKDGAELSARASVVRGRLEVAVVGTLCTRSADVPAREIEALEPPDQPPVMVDLRQANMTRDATLAMLLVLSTVLAAAKGAPVAIVGGDAKLAVHHQRELGSRIVWFAGPAQARQWLRRQTA